VYDMKKVNSSRDVSVGSLSVEGFVQRQTNCFMYENRKFLDLFRQARFAGGQALETEELRRVYNSKMKNIVGNMEVSEIGEISIPENALRKDLDSVRSAIE